ncbi:MAG: glutamate racemase [Candidatus Firestonebacteria bacterium]
MNKNNPIGVFDSGLGGLTVLRGIIKFLPYEDIIYFGDTKHLPYGSKSKETVTRLATLNIEFLLRKNVKIVVIACNTTSALSLKTLQKIFRVPIIGVIEPGSKAAKEKTLLKRVGVIGTTATIQSLSYLKVIKKMDKSITVYGKSCPLFVPLVEEGYFNGKIPSLVAEKYLSYFKDKNIDTLILGCTHYPFLKNVIKKVIKVKLIDSGTFTAQTVVKILKSKNLLNNARKKPNYKFYVTDDPEKFKKIGTFFLKKNIKSISLIDVE